MAITLSGSDQDLRRILGNLRESAKICEEYVNGGIQHLMNLDKSQNMPDNYQLFENELGEFLGKND